MKLIFKIRTYVLLLCTILSLMACEQEEASQVTETMEKSPVTNPIQEYDFNSSVRVIYDHKIYQTDRTQGDYLNTNLLAQLPARYYQYHDFNKETIYIFDTKAQLEAFQQDRHELRKGSCSFGALVIIEFYDKFNDGETLDVFEIDKDASFRTLSNRLNNKVEEIYVKNECQNTEAALAFYANPDHNNYPFSRSCRSSWSGTGNCTREGNCKGNRCGGFFVNIEANTEVRLVPGTDVFPAPSTTYGLSGNMNRNTMSSFRVVIVNL